MPPCYHQSGFLPMAGYVEVQMRLLMVLQKSIPCSQKNHSGHLRVASGCISASEAKSLTSSQTKRKLLCMCKWPGISRHFPEWCLLPLPFIISLLVTQALMMLFVYLGQLVFNWFFNKGISCSLSLWLRTIAWSHQAWTSIDGRTYHGANKECYPVFFSDT